MYKGFQNRKNKIIADFFLLYVKIELKIMGFPGPAPQLSSPFSSRIG
jgi:hypothetical protein